jgi:hypothetical protein
MEVVLGKGCESIKSNYIEHPMVKSDFSPIQKTDEGRIYSRIFTIDGGFRFKCVASKYLYPKYYAILYV